MMARSEARISVDIWAPESDFTTLSPGAQWMYFFLLSQPDLAHTGVIALRERRWSRSAAGMTVDTITGHLDELEAARYVVVDNDTEELLVRSFVRRDKVYRQPQVLRNAADQLPLVASPILRAALAVELARIAELPMPQGSVTIIAEMRAALPEPPVQGQAQGAQDPARTSPGVRGVVTAVSTGFPVPQSPDPVPRAPDPGTPPLASLATSSARADKPRDRRGTRIPDDFEPTPDMIAWAREHAPTAHRTDHEAFCDYWRGKSGHDATKVDWPATWRNWMRREHERRGNGSRASPTVDREATSDIRARQALAAGERVQAQLDQARTREITDGRP